MILSSVVTFSQYGEILIKGIVSLLKNLFWSRVYIYGLKFRYRAARDNQRYSHIITQHKNNTDVINFVYNIYNIGNKGKGLRFCSSLINPERQQDNMIRTYFYKCNGEH